MIVSDLIRQAYFTAHVTREGQEAAGFRAVQGLQFLNEILDDWGSSEIFIPYTTQVQVNLEANVYKYQSTPVIIEITEAQLVVSNNVQYAIYIANEFDFSRMNFDFPLTQRPQQVYLGREQAFDADGNLCSNLYFYPKPSQAYTVRLMTRNTLANVTLQQSLISLPPRTYKLLRYQLANDIQAVYGTELPQKFYADLNDLIAGMQALNPADMSVLALDPFRGQRRFKPWGYYGVDSGTIV